MTTFDGYTIPKACFNPNLIQTIPSLCDVRNNYIGQVPVGYAPSFFDLKGSYLQIDLDQENFLTLLNLSLQRMGIIGKGKSND